VAEGLLGHDFGCWTESDTDVGRRVMVRVKKGH